MALLSKVLRLLTPFLYGACMLIVVINGFTAPYRNWDMLGYTGSVIAWSEHDTDAIYAKTMETVKENVPQEVFDDYMSNPLSNEAKAFVQQLPFYQVKPLYNGTMWLLHQAGMALPVASWTISATCFGLLAILLYCWRPRHMSKGAWLVMVVGLTYLWPWPMAHLAYLSTPDCIATLLLNAALFAWLMRKSFRWFCIFSWLALLARPDALLLFSAIAAYFAIVPSEKLRMPRIPALLFVLFSCVTYFTVSKLSGNYGLERWFIYAFIDKVRYPAEATDHLTLQRYWDTLAPSILLFIGMGRTITMAAITLIASVCYYFKPAEGNRQWFHLMLLIWGCLIVRFLMFPGWGEDRYYFVYYLPILFACGELMTPYARALGSIVKRHRETMRAAA